MNWQLQLIGDYMVIEHCLQSVDMTTNQTASCHFSDSEVLAVYFCGMRNGHRTIYSTHQFVASYMKKWFPNLPGYQQYVKRINKMADFLEIIFAVLSLGTESFTKNAAIDSMPIILAGSQRSTRAKIAKDLCAKGYCSSKNMYYYGIKLHLVISADKNAAPFNMLVADISPANEHDIEFLKKNFLLIKAEKIFGDKAYISSKLSKQIAEVGRALTSPLKKPREKAMSLGSCLSNCFISSTRQAIETAFNWFNQRTGIANASKVSLVKV